MDDVKMTKQGKDGSSRKNVSRAREKINTTATWKLVSKNEPRNGSRCRNGNAPRALTERRERRVTMLS